MASSSSSPAHSDRCMGCDADRKREVAFLRLLRRKASSTRQRHALALNQKGIIADVDDLQEIYGWALDVMINDIRRMIENGCPYCLQKVDVAKQGLGVVTLDILNADYAPHYSTNVRWCCTRCNSEKQRLSPAVWGARRSMWELWRRHQIRVESHPEEYGFLTLSDKDVTFPALWE